MERHFVCLNRIGTPILVTTALINRPGKEISVGAPLHVLLIGNSGREAKVLRHFLSAGGFEPILSMVSTLDDMEYSLMKEYWDIIVFDYDLPNFKMVHAIQLMTEKGVDLPFIVISSMDKVENAIAAIKCGAHDYIVKTDLNRIAPAIERELRAFYQRLEQRLAVESLRHSEEKYRNLVEAARDIIFTSDIDGRITFANLAFQKMFNLKQRDLLNSRLIDYVLPQDRQYFLDSLIRKIRAGKEHISFEVRVETEPGIVHTVWFNCAPLKNNIGEVTGLTGIGHDLTERILAEKALRESEERFRSLAEQSLVGILIVGDMKIKFVNKAAANIAGYHRRNLINMEVDKLVHIVHPEDRPGIIDLVSRLDEFYEEEERRQIQSRLRIITRSGKTCWASLFIRLITLEDKKAYLILSTDITDQIQAEERMRKLNECFLSFGPDPIQNISILVKLCGEIMGASQAFYRRLNRDVLISVAQWNLDNCPITRQESDRSICFDVIRFGGKKTYIVHDMEEVSCRHGEGKTPERMMKTFVGKAVECDNKPVGCLSAVFEGEFQPGPEEKKIMGLLSSAISVEEERLRIEKELLDKNRELSDFAYMVSHDLKGTINLLKGFLLAIKDDPPLFDQYYEKVLNSFDRIIAFVNNLLNLSRAGRIIDEKIEVNLKDLLERTFKEVKTDEVNAEMMIDDSDLVIIGDLEKIRQVFYNLLRNSIQNRDPKKDKLYINIDLKKDRKECTIILRDNGSGIESEFLGKIFNAGFTLRKEKGNGFGLAIVKKIIEAHGGTIWAESPGPGRGITFYIRIPLEENAENKK